MKRFLRSKLVLALAAFIMSATATAIPFSGTITHAHAVSRTVHATLAGGNLSPLLIATLNGGGGGGSASRDQTPAAALALCVGYGNINLSLTPLPSHPLQTTVGCDKEFFSGQSTSVDYNVTNTPDFGSFVKLITNRTDDTISTCGEAVDSTSVVIQPDSCGSGPESSSIVGVAKKQGPDLAGFTIDFVRLVVSKVQIINTPGSPLPGFLDVEVQWSATWQFWGRPGGQGSCTIASGFTSPRHGSLWSMTQDFANYLTTFGGKTYNGYHSGEDWGYTGNFATAQVFSIGPGRVVKISDLTGAGLGWLIAIEHDGSFTIPGRTATVHGQTYQYPTETVTKIYSIYLHVTPRTGLVVGTCVGNGEQIATLAPIAAPHLHFEIRHPNQQPSGDWSLVGNPSNWQVFPGTSNYNGYYINVQGMVDGGVRDPSDFLSANPAH